VKTLTETSTSYRALALQVECRAVNASRGRAEARAQMLESIARIGRQIAASIAFIGFDTKLAVLPEYFLTGFPLGESIAGWAEKAALEIDGPEYEALSRIAQERKIFLSGNAYELDRHFPDLYFQTSFVINPAGETVLRYRRLNSMFAPTPHDVWDKYLDIYGLEGVFPVARTEIGNLAAIASEEILYPEIARCLVMRGAEVFLHSTSEPQANSLSNKDIAKRARAIENLAYVVSANSAGITGTDIPAGATDGGSQIIDYTGHLLAEAGPGENMAAYAEIDLEALRRYRRRPGMFNILSRQRFELYAASYSQHSFYPANTLLEKEAERAHFSSTQKDVINKLAEQGIIPIQNEIDA
jgi:predicted amidohydrolase